jgi:hypothetical protein
MLPDLTPIPIKERHSILFVERCHVDVRDGAQKTCSPHLRG